MAVSISLYETFSQTAGSASVVLSGTLTVDYTTMTATSQNGLFLTPPQGTTGPTDTFTNFTIAQNSDQTYTVTSAAGGDNFSINYTSQAPTALNASSTAEYQSSNYGSPSGQVASSQAPCFVQGTRIAVVRNGERTNIAVENLHVGDEAVTADGSSQPITWIGHRRLDCRNHPRLEEVRPVRVAAHAFAQNCPERDLVLSPGHAVCVDILGEVLIPVSSLINGGTIAQLDDDVVTYWHIALAEHGIILAENMPCESYLEMSNIGFFQGDDLTVLHAVPDVPTGDHGDFCRPFHADGPIVDFVLQRLIERGRDVLGWTLNGCAFAGVHLLVDGRRYEPATRGLSARFTFPADAKTIWIVSDYVVPKHVGFNTDGRRLGLCLTGVSIDDGFAPQRLIAAEDHRFCAGFHAVEPDGCRWTSGTSVLPPELWQGLSGEIAIRLDLARPALQGWRQPIVFESVTTVAA